MNSRVHGISGDWLAVGVPGSGLEWCAAVLRFLIFESCLAMLAAGTERGLLGDDDGTICLRKQLFVDGKKEQEPRVLVRV